MRACMSAACTLDAVLFLGEAVLVTGVLVVGVPVAEEEPPLAAPPVALTLPVLEFGTPL